MVQYPFRCSVAGVSFRQLDVVDVTVDDPVVITSEPDNPHDADAKRVEAGGRFVGYLPRAVSARLGEGDAWTGRVVERYTANGIAGLEIEVVGAAEAHDRTRAVPAPVVTRPGRTVLVKRSGRILGTLVAVEREQRRVLVATAAGVVAYPDGLVDLVD